MDGEELEELSNNKLNESWIFFIGKKTDRNKSADYHLETSWFHSNSKMHNWNFWNLVQDLLQFDCQSFDWNINGNWSTVAANYPASYAYLYTYIWLSLRLFLKFVVCGKTWCSIHQPELKEEGWDFSWITLGQNISLLVEFNDWVSPSFIVDGYMKSVHHFGGFVPEFIVEFLITISVDFVFLFHKSL